MPEVERIGVAEARRRVEAGEALLVCAYEDEAKCARMRLEGAMSLADFRVEEPNIAHDREIIFYCA